MASRFRGISYMIDRNLLCGEIYSMKNGTEKDAQKYSAFGF